MVKTSRSITHRVNLKEYYGDITAQECFICNKIFSNDDAVLRHLQKQHTDAEIIGFELGDES